MGVHCACRGATAGRRTGLTLQTGSELVLRHAARRTDIYGAARKVIGRSYQVLLRVCPADEYDQHESDRCSVRRCNPVKVTDWLADVGLDREKEENKGFISLASETNSYRVVRSYFTPGVPFLYMCFCSCSVCFATFFLLAVFDCLSNLSGFANESHRSTASHNPSLQSNRIARACGVFNPL